MTRDPTARAESARSPLAPGLGLGLLLGAAALLLLGAVAARLGLASAPPRPAGPWAWVTTRALGVTALIALALDVFLGLAMSTQRASRAVAAMVPRGRLLELHQVLGRAALMLTAGHALLLLADPYIGYDALDVLVPGLSSYRPLAVAAGILAAYLALLVHRSFRWRARLGAKGWRRLHALSFVAFFAALGHGLFAGSDTASAGMRALYVALASITTALLALRLSEALAPPRRAGASERT